MSVVVEAAALDASNPPFYRWFAGGTLNTCHNALDRHVDAGRGDQNALIYDSPVTGTKRARTYRQLRDETAALQSGDTIDVLPPFSGG